MFYDNLIKIGRRALLLSSFGLILNSCITREEKYKHLNFYSDLNNDEYPEHIYFTEGSFYVDILGNAASTHALVSYDQKKKDLPKLIQEFKEIPKDIDFVDTNKDGNIDFVWTEFFTFIRYGNGDRTFKEPINLTKSLI